MAAGFLVAVLFFFAQWGETAIYNLIPAVNPSLHFLGALLLILRWRGPETYFLAALFGLGNDIFSSLPFGVSGLLFFVASFPLRWYSIKIFQGSVMVLPFLVGFTLFVMQILTLGLVYLIEDLGQTSWVWLRDLFFFNILPSMVIAPFLYRGMEWTEHFYRIRLSERKF